MNTMPPDFGPRFVVGLAGTGLEGPLIHALQDAGAQVERCLAGDALAAAVRAAFTDGVIVEASLNRLSPDIVAELVRAGVPVFVLAAESRRDEWRALGAVALPLSTPVAEIAAQALATPRRVPRAVTPVARRGADQAAQGTTETGTDEHATVIAVVTAAGGVGGTTLSVNLAAALGAVAETMLVDANFAHPGVAASLAADVLRSLAVLARETPNGDVAWDQALDGEVQPLDVRVPRAHLLLGVPKPDMTPVISSRLLEGALSALRRRARYVIVDLGDEQGAVQRAVLTGADHVLLVARGDAVSLWQAHLAAERWRREFGFGEERLTLAVNRYDRRFHPNRQSLSWATRLPIAAMVPEDHRQAQLAIAAQRPLVFQRRSRAARALLDLADRIHGGAIVLPSSASPATSRWRLPWRWRRQPETEVTGGSPAVAG